MCRKPQNLRSQRGKKQTKHIKQKPTPTTLTSSCQEFPVTPEIFSFAKVGKEGNAVEGMWKCCCPATDGKVKRTPYGMGCEHPDPTCMAAVQNKIHVVSDKYQRHFKSCLRSGDKGGCDKSLEGVQKLAVAIQEARGQIPMKP